MTIQGEFDDAVATARHALKEFNKEPLIESKRGGSPAQPVVARMGPGKRGRCALAPADRAEQG